MTLRICLLGIPEAGLDGQALVLARRKSRALFYYLAAQAGALRREQIVSLLWIDLPRPSALQTLRTTLHGLKKALGDTLVLDGDEVSLSPAAWVDVTAFTQGVSPVVGEQAAADPAALAAALALYRGDFLEGFSLPGAQAFEDWAAIERERLRRLAVRGWAALAGLWEAAGDYRAALEGIERALAFNPLQEDLQREVIRLLFLAGDRPGAIQRYDDLRRLLDDEMGVPPMAETRTLYDVILSERPAPELLHPARPAPRRLSRVAAFSAPANPARPGPAGQDTGGPSPMAPGTTPESVTQLSDLPFIGREAERQTVEAHLQPGHLVLIEGEPGIGKTRLAVEILRRRGERYLVGRCRELEQALPYQPVIAALRQLLDGADGAAWLGWLRQEVLPVWMAEVARLLPELSERGAPPPARPAEEARLWEGVRQFLLVAARRAPLLLLIDDLHWADAATLGLLGYLVRQTGPAPLCLLATARPALGRSPLAVLLQALTREARLWRLPLERLSQADVEQAAAALAQAGWAAGSPTRTPGAGGADAAHLAGWLWQTSEGNPYILVELARHARTHGIPGLPDAPVVPHTIYSLIQSRLRSLSDAARRFLDAAVAGGREFDFDVIARAAGLSEGAALDALDELLAVGLVTTLPDGRYAFDHPLTMEVAYREVGEARHRLLHRRVAEALKELYPDRSEALAAQIALHFSEGGVPQQAAPYALQAALQAARLAAWNEAIAFYELALKGVSSGERLPVWTALADAHAKAGHFPQACDVLRQALAWVDDHPQARGWRESLLLALGRNLIPQARFAEVIELAQGLCGGDNPESGIYAELLWGTALGLEGADLGAADEHLQAAEEGWQAAYGAGGPAVRAESGTQASGASGYPVPPGDHALLSQIHFERGGVAAQRGDLPRAIQFYRQALADIEPAAGGGQPALGVDYALEQRILCYNNLAYHLHLLGDPAAGWYAQQGLGLAQEKGVVGLQTYLYSTLGEIALAAGELDVAEAHFKAGLALAEAFHISERVAGITANLGLLAIQRGQPAAAIHHLSTALGLADALGTRHLAVRVRLWLAPLLPLPEAHRRLAEARSMADESGRQGLLEEARQVEEKLG